jgi:hypothetical protein
VKIFWQIKKTNISYSDRKHFKLGLGNLYSVLQVEGKTVKYRNGFFEKSCKDLVKLRTEVSRETMRVTQTILERMEKQHVHMVWTLSVHGG